MSPDELKDAARFQFLTTEATEDEVNCCVELDVSEWAAFIDALLAEKK